MKYRTADPITSRIVARIGMRELVVLFAALAMMTIYSGKRRSFGTMALIPVVRVFLEGISDTLPFT